MSSSIIPAVKSENNPLFIPLDGWPLTFTITPVYEEAIFMSPGLSGNSRRSIRVLSGFRIESRVEPADPGVRHE